MMTFGNWLDGRVLRPDDLGLLARLASSQAHPAPLADNLDGWHAWLDVIGRPELADALSDAYTDWSQRHAGQVAARIAG